MLEYAMPPEIPAIPAARIGHNSKAQLADKIAAVRQAFLDANLSETATFRHKLLSIAYASGMNPADFHVLWGLLTHGSADGGNIAVSQKKLAMISGRGERTVRRIIETLEEDGWLTAPKKQRRLPLRVHPTKRYAIHRSGDCGAIESHRPTCGSSKPEARTAKRGLSSNPRQAKRGLSRS